VERLGLIARRAQFLSIQPLSAWRGTEDCDESHLVPIATNSLIIMVRVCSGTTASGGCRSERLVVLVVLALSLHLPPSWVPTRRGVFLPTVAAQSSSPATSIVLTERLRGLGSITDLQHAPGDTTVGGRLYVVIRDGLIKIVDGVTASGTTPTIRATPFLDISGRVKAGGERGLLGLAFHPEFTTYGYFFVNYIYKDSSQPEQSCDSTTSGGNVLPTV
jgi:hypothetical protein